MSDTEKTPDGVEIYIHDIFYYADQYVDQELGGKTDRIKEMFPDMLVYIAERIPKPPNENIGLLDSIFDIYVRLCTRNGVLPTLESFSWLVGVERRTFTDWSQGRYRSSTAHPDTVKKWFDICKSHTVNRLINKGGTDANLIFAAKAAYGMAETAPVPMQAQQEERVLSAAELPKLGDFRDFPSNCTSEIREDMPVKVLEGQ